LGNVIRSRLSKRLGEGIISGYSDMHEFRFESNEVSGLGRQMARALELVVNRLEMIYTGSRSGSLGLTRHSAIPSKVPGIWQPAAPRWNPFWSWC
jgi:hypothetical protein